MHHPCAQRRAPPLCEFLEKRSCGFGAGAVFSASLATFSSANRIAVALRFGFAVNVSVGVASAALSCPGGITSVSHDSSSKCSTCTVGPYHLLRLNGMIAVPCDLTRPLEHPTLSPGPLEIRLKPKFPLKFRNVRSAIMDMQPDPTTSLQWAASSPSTPWPHASRTTHQNWTHHIRVASRLFHTCAITSPESNRT